MTNFADIVYSGTTTYARNGSQRGAPYANAVVIELGAVTTATENAIVSGVTATGAVTLGATGSLVSGGVATFDVPRTVSVTGTGDNAAVTFTVTGADYYGATMIEAKVGATGGTISFAKAFKTVSSVAVSAATAGAVSVGTSAVLGVPYRLGNAGKVFGMTISGVSATSVTYVAGLSTTTVSTATTADVRGTFVTSGNAPDAAKFYTIAYDVSPFTTQADLYGVDQYGG